MLIGSNRRRLNGISILCARSKEAPGDRMHAVKIVPLNGIFNFRGNSIRRAGLCVTAWAIKLARNQSCVTWIDPIMPGVRLDVDAHTNYGLRTSRTCQHERFAVFCNSCEIYVYVYIYKIDCWFQALRFATAMQLTEVISVPSKSTSDAICKDAKSDDNFERNPSNPYKSRNTRENPVFSDKDEVWKLNIKVR